MKDKIFNALKQEYARLGLGDNILMGLAEMLASTSLVTEENLQAIECLLESHDFESAIRIAISLGGDSDTIANITGGIAEAYYGVPEEMQSHALQMLPEEMRRVVQAMYE